MTLKYTPTLGIALTQEFGIFRSLIKITNKHQIEPSRYHWKGFEI
jgi:hypothetical protein